MGATYTRQSTYNDGDTITADHTNDEFDQLLAAFAASTGHTHDGTTGEGGPITKLATTSVTIGDGTTGTDITVTFDGESNDGVFKWMEDEDYFEFSDDLLIASTEKIQFRDTAIYLNSSADGQLDIVADTEIQIAATTIDMNGAADISGNLAVGGNLTVAGNATVTGTTTFNGGTITMGDAATDNVVFGADVNSSIIPNTDSTFDLGSASQEWRDLYIDGTAHLDAINFNGTAITATAAELNILDGVTATATELNLIDGVTATTAELNILDGVTSTAAELNILDVSGSTIGDLAEISSIASDDVLLALDTSGGGIKKVARSTLVSGLATSSAISNVVEDTSPQLGGSLDVQTNAIVSTSNRNIAITPNGSGVVNLDGVEISDGIVGIKTGTGNVAKVLFYCESGNAHAQTLQAQPHSAGASDVLVLPTGGNSTLVSRISTDTLTNKTLTTPVLTTPIANAGVQLKNGSTSAGFLEFFEDSDNGTNKVTIIGPASTADITLTLPTTAGTVATEEAATTIAADEATALAIALG